MTWGTQATEVLMHLVVVNLKGEAYVNYKIS